MPRTFDQILAELAALKAEDFNEDKPTDGIQKLYGLSVDIEALPQPERCVSVIFAFFERLPDAYLGTPGSLVHALETMRGHYEHELVESIKRRPTDSTVSMAIRIFNGSRDAEQRQFYMDLVRFAMEHPLCSEAAFYVAQNFIEYRSRAA
jgi:hypothetical protein